MNVYKHADEYRTVVSGTQEQMEAIKKIIDTYNDSINMTHQAAEPNRALSQVIWNSVYTAYLVPRPEGMAFLVIDINFTQYLEELFEGLKNDYDKDVFEGNDNALETVSSFMTREVFDTITTLYKLIDAEYYKS